MSNAISAESCAQHVRNALNQYYETDRLDREEDREDVLPDCGEENTHGTDGGPLRVEDQHVNCTIYCLPSECKYTCFSKGTEAPPPTPDFYEGLQVGLVGIFGILLLIALVLRARSKKSVKSSEPPVDRQSRPQSKQPSSSPPWKQNFSSEEEFCNRAIEPLIEELAFDHEREYPVEHRVGSKTSTLRVDYLLLDAHGGQIAVLEAKREIQNQDQRDKAASQVLSYALFEQIPVVLLAAPQGLWLYRRDGNELSLQKKYSFQNAYNRPKAVRTEIIATAKTSSQD